MKRDPKGLEAITVRRAKLVDADKVRYRVYKSPTEFVAVIAESALLAVRAAGIQNPHKIVRDLPTEAVALDAKHIAAGEEERVTIVSRTEETSAVLNAELSDEPKPTPEEAFVPMGVLDLQRKKEGRMRILPPDMVLQIIEDYAKKPAPSAAPELAVIPQPLPPAMQESPVPAVTVAAEPVVEAVVEPQALPAQPEQEEAEVVIAEEVHLDPAARVLAMANAMLPVTEKTVTTEAPPSASGPVLSPIEVKKLLNEE